jgi:hypothetical protein
MTGFNMDDYVSVPERIDAFYAKYPDGVLQSEIVELSDSRVTVKAYAYRSPGDPRPGTGHSWVEIPGRTTFTRGSEIENAETSAWGRAIASLGFETKRGISSAEEVRSKQSDDTRAGGDPRGSSSPRRPASTPRTKGDALSLLADVGKDHGLSFAQIEAKARSLGIDRGSGTVDDILRLVAAIEQPEAASAHAAPADSPEAGSSVPASGSTPSSETVSSDAATAAAPESPPGAAAGTPSMDDILAATGGEEIPPKPGTKAYRELPSGTERANAKAYWDRKPAEQQESLVEALGGPAQ